MIDQKVQKVEQFKEVMGSYPTGVTVMTTLDNSGEPVGMTVNSFASVSIDPLLVLWCIGKGSSNYEKFKNSEYYAVNILNGSQTEECKVFSNKNEKDRFSKTNWELSKNDLPVVKESFATLECRKYNYVDAGDHLILIGEVIDIHKNIEEPMLYYKRNVGYANL